MKFILFLSAVLFSILFCKNSFAQKCPYFPADCPDDGSIEASQSRSSRIGNGILPQEVDMQDKMRRLTIEMMQHAAKTLGWELVEIDEYTNNGALQSGGTPAALRSPRMFGIEFEFIVNSDSLRLWKEWLQDFSSRYLQASSDVTKKQNDVANSPLYKQYTDSVNRYVKLYTDYITDHQNEGANLFSDPKLIQLEKKQKEFIDKQTALLNQKESENNSKQYEAEKTKMILQFRAASTVEIFFQFNEEVGIIHNSGDEQVSNYNFPGAAFARLVHNSQPDPYTTAWHFDQWQNMIVLLFGNWLPGVDQYKNYNAAFKLNEQDDEHTPKKITSDKVQTIAIHVTGNKSNMDKLIRQLDVEKLNSARDKK